MLILPREEREERAIGIFLEYYNQTHGTSYKVSKWLDRSPQKGQKPPGPTPDCLCIDSDNKIEMVIERTMLTGKQDLKLTQGAEKFLTEVQERLNCKLPGVFLLYDWGVNAIEFTNKNKEMKINQFCQEILAAAPKLVESEEVPISQPFPVKIRKEEAHKVKTNCALFWFPLRSKRATNKKQLEQVLEETNRKFTRYTDKQTVLLINIWETGLNYERFEEELFKGVVLGKYPNIKHIYLSEGLPKPPICHLWSKS